MDYPFNDEIFDHDNEEIFQNNQLESESLWCNSLIDISEYDNQFFHEESEFPDFLTTNSNTLIQSHEINPFSLDITEDNNNNTIDLQLSPAQLKPESTFDSKLYDTIQKQNAKSVSNICKQKSKSQPFIIENLSQSKNITFVATESVDHPSSDSIDFINPVNDLKFPSTILSLNQIDEHSPEDFSRKNVFYLDQYNSFNRKSKPTIFLAKRNPITNYRKSISKLRKTENSSLYSMYQDPGNRSQAQRVTYSLSPSTSSPDSAVDFSLSVSGPQKPYNDDSSIFSGHNNPPNRFYEMKYKVDKTTRENLYASKISSSRLFQSPIPQTGILILTEEEKRTMLMENYSIPTRLPLTKQEERNLKKVRRKIKNKISAQESRRKKKEYMEALEKKVEIYAHENNDLKKRLENQESLNKSLLGQLRHLQQMLGRAGSNTASTCLMVFLLCFSLILVGMPNRLQTMTPPQSVLVVSNIHKMGYGSIKNIQRSQMTAMQRYFPPDINVLLENTKTKIMFLSNNESLFAKDSDRGNEPIESIFNVNDVLITVSDQRKGILLENTKDEEEDCIQYGPKYLWWLHQFTNPNPVEDPVTSTPSVSIANYSESGNNSSATKESEGILFNSLIGTSNISEPNIENNWYNSTDDHFKLSFFSLST